MVNCESLAIEGVHVSPGDEKLHLYLSHRAALIEYALPIVGDRMRAEDVVQEAYLRFAPSTTAPADPVVNQPLRYLYRIVRNLAYDVMRRRLTEQRYQLEEPNWWMVPATPRTPEEKLAFRQKLNQIDEILGEFSPEVRLAVKMHRLGGYTLREVADQLGISVNMVHRMVRDAVAVVAARLP
jgi:RNA polymerase sigma-70 factor (ECF subfamily)